MSATDERVQHYCADGVCTPSRHALTGAEALEKINERQYTPVKQSGGLPAWVVIGGAVAAVGIGGQVVWEFDRELMEIPSLVTGQLVIPAAFFTAIGLVVWFVWSRLGRPADSREMARQDSAAKQDGWGGKVQTYQVNYTEQREAARGAEREERERQKQAEKAPEGTFIFSATPPNPSGTERRRRQQEQRAEADVDRYEREVDTIWNRMNADADRNLYNNQ